MKKSIILLILAIVTVNAFPQERRYQREMQTALEVMQNASDPVETISSAGNFEEIADDYPDRWMPCYYAAQILTVASLDEQDGPTCDTLLKRADVFLDRAIALAPEESEVHALSALHLLARMKVDPETRGPMLYEDFYYTLEKARRLDAENPRVYYMEGLMTANMPEMMGGGPDAARPIFKKAAEKFETFQKEDPFWPSWGEELNREQLQTLQ